MLSKEEIQLRRERRDSLNTAGIGLEFGKSLVQELQDLHAFGDSKAKINQTAANAQVNIENTYNSVRQNDLTRSILSGVDLNSGTVQQIAQQRSQVLAQEQRRLEDERLAARRSLSDQESSSFLGAVGTFLSGALKWLLS